jgi:hypothetical protein
VSGLTGNPPLLEAVISLAILGGSYLVARLASSLLARLVTRRAARGEPGLHSRLVVALRGPITFALFLIGAWVAVHRLPLTGRGTAALDGTLFVAGVFVFAMALVRLFGILLAWYAAHPRLAHESHPAVEFGPLLGKLGTVFIGLVAVITSSSTSASTSPPWWCRSAWDRWRWGWPPRTPWPTCSPGSR